MLTNKEKLTAVLTLILVWLLPNMAFGQAVDPSFLPPNLNGPVYTIVSQPDGKILLGGAFNLAGWPNGWGFAVLNQDGSLNANPRVDYHLVGVYALGTQSDGQILVGGNGYGVTRYNPIAGMFDPSFYGAFETFALVRLANDQILVGGRSALARLFPGTGARDTTFNPNVNGVDSIAVQPDGKILVGGPFTSAGGAARQCLVRFNADGTLDAAFNVNASSFSVITAYAIAVQPDGKILAGGTFTSLGGVTRNYLARLNTNGTLDTAFNPNPNGGVRAITVQADGKILIGGDFTSVGGIARARLARLNTDGTVDATFNNLDVGPCCFSVNALPLQADGKILLGGTFTSVGGQTRNYLTRLSNTGPASQTLSATTSIITWTRGGASPEVDRVTFESSTDGANYTNRGNATRIGTTSNWQLTGLSLPSGNLYLRARGYQMFSGAYGDGSSYEAVQSVDIAPDNTAPTITGAMIARQQGSPASFSQIATVYDTQDDENTMSVTATALTGAGVKVSEISVDGSGNVTAKVEVGCTAINSTFNLHVTDSGGLSADAILTVNVNANTAPTLTYPSNPGIVYGTGLTINPLTGPSDNVSVSSVTLQSVNPPIANGISVDSFGIVTVANDVPAGTYIVTVRATDNCGLNTDASFTLGIAKATPVITWNNPAEIVYGTALSATELNATANVAGSFSYSPASGTVLNAGNSQSLSVAFTPTDTTNYNNATATVTINVLKATPTVTWNNPADITYGTALSGTQLNATTSVAGSFVYAPLSGTVMNAGNAQSLSVTFMPMDTDNYNTASKTVAINVLRALPVITWSNPADIVYGTALSPTELNATANVGGSFSYSPASGSLLDAGNGQPLSVTFNPTDSGNYTAATKTVAINVLKATPNVTWSNPADIVYGTALSATQLNATASIAGSFAYTPASGVVLNAGNGQTLSVLFTPTNATNYNTVSRSVTINVLKATPVITWNPPTTLSAGTTLSTAQLNATANVPGTFSYTPTVGTMLVVGPQTLTANFTPTDTANYNLASKSVVVTVVSGFNFVGFFQPVDNAPIVNTVAAGSAIPVKFSLTGNWGLSIFATGYPASQAIACSSGTPTSDIEETVNAGASSLSYDATTDRYTYVWKTDKTWKGTCRKLILKFSDGTTREALFQFK